MCIWKVGEEERHCELCTYRGGCEMREMKETVEEAGRRYVSVLCGILGRDVRERSRERQLVWARNMVFYQLVQDGFSQSEIGGYMGYDHATVFHGKEQMKNMLKFPGMYVEEMAIWNKFQKSISL